MKFKFDHDYHIHSKISLCSNDPEQTTERILQYAKDCKLRTLVLTDHYWDSDVPGASGWYQKQPFEWIAAALPLPKDDEVRFLFGCESDIDKYMTLGIPEKRFDDFDFMVIPTTHLHMTGFTLSKEDAESEESNRIRADLWVERLEKFLEKELPFRKIGLAHLACPLINKRSRGDYLETLDMIPSEDMERLFSKAAKVGVGIELNYADMRYSDAEADTVLRMFRIAKSCGCKFYCGSDAHHPATFERVQETYERAVNMLYLTENDKFYIDGIGY